MNEPWRRTGRTTAMVKRALEAAARGERVLILVLNGTDAHLVSEILERDGGVAGAVRLVRITTIDRPDLIRGVSFNRFDIDHHAWEADPSRTARAVLDIEGRIVAPEARRVSTWEPDR